MKTHSNVHSTERNAELIGGKKVHSDAHVEVQKITVCNPAADRLLGPKPNWLFSCIASFALLKKDTLFGIRKRGDKHKSFKPATIFVPLMPSCSWAVAHKITCQNYLFRKKSTP